MEYGMKPRSKYHFEEELFAKRIKNARLRSGMTLVELAMALDRRVDPSTLSKYENGKAIPPAGLFFHIFKILDTCPNDFVKPFREDMGNLEFRKPIHLGIRKTYALEQQVAYALERHLDIEEVLGIESSFHNPIPGSRVCSIGEVDQAAHALRQAWELGHGALPNVMETLEGKGIKLVETRVGPGFDALACRVDGKLPLIAVNRDLAPEEKRQAILRELGHLLLDFDQGMIKKEVERLCQAFACAMLIPQGTFFREMGPAKRKGISIPELLILKETYGIPLQAVVSRAYGLGLIGRRQHDNFKKYMLSEPWETEPCPYRGKEGSERFKRLVLRAVSEALISISEAASFLNVPRDGLEEEFISL